MRSRNYATNVFINCPFDEQYRPIRDAIVFAVFDCGFLPRCSLEEEDGADTRATKLQRIIKDCKFGIHDVSRTQLDGHNQLPRFNMPFELGLFLGAKAYGPRPQKDKSCLIVDCEQYRFQQFISDIAGQDIRSHANDPRKAIKAVREWLNTTTGRRTIPGGKAIGDRYGRFNGDLPFICSEAKLEPDEITYNDYCNFVSDWLTEDE